MADQGRQYLDSIGPHDKLVMIGPKTIGNAPGMADLAEVLLVKPYGKGLDAPARKLAHKGDDRAGIDSAGQKSPERHIGHQAHADGFPQKAERALAGLFLGYGRLTFEIQRPVPLDPGLAVLPDEQVSGLELAHAAESGQRSGNA